MDDMLSDETIAKWVQLLRLQVMAIDADINYNLATGGFWYSQDEVNEMDAQKTPYLRAIDSLVALLPAPTGEVTNG